MAAHAPRQAQESQESYAVTAGESKVLDLVWDLLQKLDGKVDTLTTRVISLETKNSNEVAIDDSVRVNGLSRRGMLILGFAALGAFGQLFYDVITVVQHH